jgi:4-amino-4-deoxy-L-arabinose transferase-like glycosyltransferase
MRIRSYAVVLALAAILVVAAALRVWLLWDNLPELFADELDSWVSMHSIATTGVDIDGTLQPFLASSLTRNPPVYGAVAYASTLLLGTTPLGFRLPAALFGLASVVLLYAVTWELTRRQTVALLAAALLAIAPIAVHFSRIGWEPAALLPFMLGGLYALLRTLRRAESAPVSFGDLIVAAVLLALTAYTYSGAWLYSALLAGALLMLRRDVFRANDDRRRLLAAIAVYAALAAPAYVTLFTDPAIVARNATISTFASGITFATLGTFISNYVAHFSWMYLFADGDVREARYLYGFSALYWWMAPLIVVALFYLRRYVAGWAAAWIVLWLLIYPLGGALTNDGVPHPPRTLAGIPVLCILAAIGTFAVFEAILQEIVEPRVRRRASDVLASLIMVCTALSLISFCRFYFVTYPRTSADRWESGNREVFAYLRSAAPSYARLCFNGVDYYHMKTLTRFYLPPNVTTIFDDNKQPECSAEGTLLMATTPIRRPGFAQLATVPRPDGTVYAVIEARGAR